MQANFDLIISADTSNLTAELELRDAHGNHLAYRLTEFKGLAHARGLFDLRDYLRNYVVLGEEPAAVAEIGVCIAEQVLGAEIFRHLYASKDQRTLRIQLPGATEEGNLLAAALARVPWEIARPAADQPSLGEHNLLVRVVHQMNESATQPLAFSPHESLRVLFVFAEAPGSRPLAARLERRALRQLFEKEIYPSRRIEAHFLTHGVTRARLRDQIQQHGGYHLVHWSGHGHLNLLELAKAGGGRDHLSGEALLELFVDAGGFLPRLFFLSACHSGDILRVKDWNDFMAVAQGKEPQSKESHPETTKDIRLEEQPGYTGTAHALLQGGVPAVVAMRYAVGDEYARELAVEFYRALLAHPQPKDAAAALTMARKQLLTAADQSRYAACDHATPVLYGAAQSGLHWQKGRSPALDMRDPRLHQITELTVAAHEHFVGRTWELARLGADFIGSDAQPVAVITGLGGMGKTALTAETLALWQKQFDWVLLYQAKPNALSFENTLRDIHIKLNGELGRYHEHVKARPADAIYRDASAEFTGAERFERLTRNLLRALRDEAILLVLDNFETNLKPLAQDPNAAEPVWACQDANWERCLARLADELRESRSRVLITCRRPLAALQNTVHQPVRLGPLPAGEAALYLREHAGLSRMFFSSDPAERALAMRLLDASRFHPLLMDRLARLATAKTSAGSHALRPQLMQALTALEQSHDYAQLPALFADQRGGAQELEYLNDALAASLDQFIADASPDARRLLWMIAVANEPIELALLESVWSAEESEQTQQFRQIKQLLEMLPQLPPHVQEQLKALPPEFRAAIDALPPVPSPKPLAPNLLRYLIAIGLITEERTGPSDPNPSLSCHELVRERICARMAAHPQERADLTENNIRLGYADRLITAFRAFRNENTTAALHVGSRALVYCVQAEAYDRLGNFASGVITNISNPHLLAALLPHLQAVTESAPPGRPRWVCLCNFADALARGGHPDASLLFYEQAATQSRYAAMNASPTNPDARLAWTDVGWITGNWANALVNIGNLEAARQQYSESAEAKKNAGLPAISIITIELETLRTFIMQGEVTQVLPQVEARLTQIETWWQQHRAGQAVPEAPDFGFLASAYISALDIITDAHYAQQDWKAALPRIDATLDVQHTLQRPIEDLTHVRMNRAFVLKNLGRFGEAHAEFESGLQVFQDDPRARARALSMLADLFNEQGDVAEAIRQERRALTFREQLPDPHDRAISHNNLALYIEYSGTPAALAEAPRHMLAALLYLLVAGLGQDMQTSLRNYARRFRRAHAAGTVLAVPRVVALLADPAFAPLDAWLRQRQVDVDELQVAVDQLLEQVQQQALAAE